MDRIQGKDFWANSAVFDERSSSTLSKDLFERWAAAFELGELGDPRAVQRLWELLSDDDEFVRQAGLLNA